jgi:putative DNA primase/helicase
MKLLSQTETNIKGQGRAIIFGDPELWPEAVNGAELLNGLSEAIRSHVVMSDEAVAATALWVVHTYLMDTFNTSPRLAITSPEKRCGKTTLLDVLGILTWRPLSTANATPAAVFRVIELAQPTLLMDEADTFLKENIELRGILNSGHRRWSAFVMRTVGDDHEPRQFSTWAAVAIAMIGRLPTTLEDRSIQVTLRRRLSDEKITPFDYGGADDLRRLAGMSARWCADNKLALGNSRPAMPEGIYNREAENWLPVLAIADAAGGEWPGRARKAATMLVLASVGEDQSTRTMLLTDIRFLFDGCPDENSKPTKASTDKLTTREMIDGLAAIEERPWLGWHRGKPISPAALAKLLAPFGIVPANLKLPEERVLQGYRREHFEDAFTRYLPLPGFAAATPLLRPLNGRNLHVSQPLPETEGSGRENYEKPNSHRRSSGVAAPSTDWAESGGA